MMIWEEKENSFLGLKWAVLNPVWQGFWNWLPQRSVRVSDRRKYVMSEECYWWSSISTYE